MQSAPTTGGHFSEARDMEQAIMGEDKLRRASHKTPTEVIRAHLVATATKSFGANQWGARHILAWEGRGGSGLEPGVFQREGALRLAITGWALLGETHRLMYESDMGEDYVLGVAWKEMGSALLAQLNGQCGRFDCGTLDGLIRDIAMACGVSLDE